MILGNKIKDGLAIKSSVKRIAYQIYENNIDEKSIVIVGIGNRGKIFRNLIGNSIKSICDLNLIFVSLSIKKKKLLNVVESDISLEEIKNKSIIIVDDVLNTGVHSYLCSIILFKNSSKKNSNCCYGK